MIELWTSPTPNGWKVSIMLEELIEAGIDVGEVEIRVIDLMKGEQFADDFVARNPNSKIPSLRDGERHNRKLRYPSISRRKVSL